MVSCSENFIEILPESEMTTDLLFKTDKDFEVAVNGVYREFHSFHDYFWEFGDLAGDDAEHLAQRSTERVNMDNFFVDVNSDIIHDSWRDLYAVIARANTVLSKLEAADASIIPGKDQYEGEAKFLRALAYFNLIRIFGDVPMITTPISVQDALETPRTNVDIIYNEVIIKDLLEVEAKLPETYSEADVGGATKGAAKALLGKVYLTRQDFDLAESKLMEVTTMGYALLDNFEDLFDFDNEHHSEYIFDIEYIDGNIGLGSPFTLYFNPADQDVGSDLVDALRQVFNYQGRRGGNGTGSPSAELIDLFDPNDLRKDRTASTGIYDLEGNWVEPNPGLLVTSFTLKYAQPGYNFDFTDGKANWRVIRYADVLLMLAEALNENGKTTESLTYLNQVRTRAGLSGYSDLAQSEARDKIYLERRFELYMEGQRWFDLVRTGRALSVMEPYGMKPHMTVFPIPQSQIEVVNDPNILPQNPGY
jgi:hypothetical protein